MELAVGTGRRRALQPGLLVGLRSLARNLAASRARWRRRWTARNAGVFCAHLFTFYFLLFNGSAKSSSSTFPSPLRKQLCTARLPGPLAPRAGPATRTGARRILQASSNQRSRPAATCSGAREAKGHAGGHRRGPAGQLIVGGLVVVIVVVVVVVLFGVGAARHRLVVKRELKQSQEAQWDRYDGSQPGPSPPPSPLRRARRHRLGEHKLGPINLSELERGSKLLATRRLELPRAIGLAAP